MDGYGYREIEIPPDFLEWLAGWSVIMGLCVLFWLTVYRLAVHWSAAY